MSSCFSRISILSANYSAAEKNDEAAEQKTWTRNFSDANPFPVVRTMIADDLPVKNFFLNFFS